MLNNPFAIFEGVEDIVVNEFNDAGAKKFREQVMKIAKFDPERPIIVYIDSYGGEVDALASMVETIKSIPNKVVTVALGKAMSAGAMLLSLGDYRFCGENSRIMIHEISAGAFGNVHNMKNDVGEIQRMNTHWFDIVAKRCGLKDYQELRNIMKARDGQEYYMDAKEAKKFGLVDAIGMPIITPHMMYSIQNSNPTDPIQPPKGAEADQFLITEGQMAAMQEEPPKKFESKKKKKSRA